MAIPFLINLIPQGCTLKLKRLKCNSKSAKNTNKEENKMVNINDLTLGQIKEIQSMTDGSDTNCQSQLSPFVVGESYLFRTVTHIEVGRVKAIKGQFVELEDASWIADTGRYHDCLAKGTFNEVEPYPLYTGVNTQSLINYAPWPHNLPREQK